ncbi:MAG: hypothetical protein WC789_04755 [Lentisphaeria bacterium]|jgi:hypothetical protein
MQSNPIILIAVVCGFFLLLLGMIVFVVLFIRKESAEKAKIAQSLGLTPAADTQQLLQKVASVNGITSSGLYRLEQVFHRHHDSGEDVYLFSLHRSYFNEQGVNRGKRPTGSHKMTLEASVLAFISSSWKLPRFVALPRLGGDGKLADIGNSLSEAAAEIKQEVVKFPHIPNLDEQYLIATPETPASQVNPPERFLRVLTAHPNLRLHAGGDTITLSYANSNSQIPDEEKMKHLYKIGMQLAQELK